MHDDVRALRVAARRDARARETPGRDSEGGAGLAKGRRRTGVEGKGASGDERQPVLAVTFLLGPGEEKS